MGNILELKAIVTVGISASGKSSFAKEICKDESWVEINRDEIRKMLFGDVPKAKYKFTKGKESAVTEVQGKMIMDSYFNDKNIVISDTNLKEGRRNNLIKQLEDVGYTVVIKDFPVTIEEAWRRDSIRNDGVGQSVIASQWGDWIKYKGHYNYKPDVSLPEAVIVDIDGTVATNDGGRGWYEWSAVGKDKPRKEIMQIVKMLSSTYRIIFLSGRDSVCREETLNWLIDHYGSNDFLLYMREEGSMLPDTVVKLKLFKDHLKDNYNVVMAIDDRPCVIRLWHDIGIKNVLCVSNPWLEF